MSDSLQTGVFYGATRRRRELGGVVLSELTHAHGRKLPCHTHESAYFGLLLAGSYSERCSHRAADYEPFTLGFHPPALTHSDEVGRSGSRMFCVELRGEYLERTRKFLTAPRFVPDLCATPVTWLALRLYWRFANETLDQLELEELCGDMIERVSTGSIASETAKPAWLEKAVELLVHKYGEALSLDDIAREVGVHPIHLSRVFRKNYGCTMSEFVNRIRVQYACRALAASWGDLAAVAGEAGFADQSHMGRVLKQYTGQTPGRLRSFLHTAL
jgi:AraC family transcriptional regulator